MVDDERQVIQLEMGAGHSRFPDDAFFDFPIAADDVGAPAGMIETGSQCHAVAGRQALSQRPRGHIDTRRAVHIGYALKHGAAFPEIPQFLFWKETMHHKRRIESWCGMAFGENEPVAAGPVRFLGPDMHEFPV